MLSGKNDIFWPNVGIGASNDLPYMLDTNSDSKRERETDTLTETETETVTVTKTDTVTVTDIQ